MIGELLEFSHVSVAKDCIPTVSTEMAHGASLEWDGKWCLVGG